MKNFFGLFDEDDKAKKDDKKSKVVDNDKLYLRKEELDIAKNRVQTGEVEISKEIVEEQKVVDVPVTHEEVVIERRALGNEPSDEPIGEEQRIRIPVSEDHVEVGKHTIVTGEVSAHKRQVEETRQVKETLKREEARINKDGDPNIVADEKDDMLH
jgi:conserved domain